jgi:transposase
MADHEARLLRREITERERGRGKRYPPGLRDRATRWIRARMAAGTPLRAVAVAIGLGSETARRWLRAHRVDVGSAIVDTATALVPVEIVDTDALVPARASRLAVVAPSGFRIEGLTLDEAATLLARLR